MRKEGEGEGLQQRRVGRTHVDRWRKCKDGWGDSE